MGNIKGFIILARASAVRWLRIRKDELVSSFWYMQYFSQILLNRVDLKQQNQNKDFTELSYICKFQQNLHIGA